MPSSPGVRTGAVPREQLVSEIRDRLTRFGAPRLQLLLIVVLAGLAAFLASVAGLRVGVTSMTVRYPIATVAGYVTFIALLRAWIAWQRRSWPDFDVDPGFLDVDLDVPRFGRPGNSGEPFFAGGRSGGGGAASEMGDVEGDAAMAGGEARFHPSLDADELWPVLLALVCALGGVLAVAWVVWTAPLLLAELALDGAVFAAVYRRLHARDAAHWAVTTIRRTWNLAAILVLFAAIGGYAFDQVAPGARSIGGVVRALAPER